MKINSTEKKMNILIFILFQNFVKLTIKQLIFADRPSYHTMCSRSLIDWLHCQRVASISVRVISQWPSSLNIYRPNITCFQKYNFFLFFLCLICMTLFSLFHFIFCSSRVIFRSFIFIGVLISDFVYTHT